MITTMHPQPQRDSSLNLGTGPSSPESRTGSFAHGVLGSEALLADQHLYADLVPREYMQHGVAQLTQNTRSALSFGVAESPRTGIFRGQRWLMAALNGRSASTSQAQPVFDEDL